MQNETQTIFPKIWTRVNDYISNDNKRYRNRASYAF